MNAQEGGLRFIESQQRPDGGFWEYCLDDNNDIPPRYRTTYTPSVIALALSEVTGSAQIQKDITVFLRDQMSPDGSWNYWAKSSKMISKAPYPDDLDDTFLALGALSRYDKQFLNPQVSARIARLLFACETQPGGPYKTWLLEGDHKEWSDIDVVVNANIAGFLALQDIDLPHLTELVEQAIGAGEEGLVSSYYPSPIHAAYFISKWYRGGLVNELRQIILAHQKDNIWETPHRTALAVSALIGLGYPANNLKSAIDYLGRQQQADGSWQAGAMCLGVRGCSSGAPSLTTAVCLEAIAAYRRTQHRTRETIKQPVQSATSVTAEIVRRRIDALKHAPELQAKATEVFTRILDRDRDGQVVHLPSIIATAAHINAKRHLVNNLAVASLWGWMAYTVYDDFLDNEGEPSSLPAAIFSHREMTRAFWQTLPNNPAFHNEVDATLTRIDQANAWELGHCRARVVKNRLQFAGLPDYGDYWQLADRSLGHSLPALGVFYSAGEESGSARMNALRDFFRHYLIARQLNDDAHDWQKDLQTGHINAVAVRIIGQWRLAHPRKNVIHLVKEREALELIMWEVIIDGVCRDIIWHAEQARGALKNARLDETQMMPLIQPLIDAAKRALRERDETLEFLAALHGDQDGALVVST
jgi:hypothetical protein